MSEDEQNDEKVEEAAAHAARSVEHRRQMQRESVKAEAAEGSDESELEREAAEHGEAAAEQEQEAAETPRARPTGSPKPKKTLINGAHGGHPRRWARP